MLLPGHTSRVLPVAIRLDGCAFFGSRAGVLA